MQARSVIFLKRLAIPSPSGPEEKTNAAPETGDEEIRHGEQSTQSGLSAYSRADHHAAAHFYRDHDLNAGSSRFGAAD